MDDEIKSIIVDYIKFSDQLDIITKESKGIRDSKKLCENKIKDHMIKNNIGEVSLGKAGKLNVKESQKAPKKLGKNEVFDCLLENIEHNKAEVIIEKMFDINDIEVVTKLERKK